jgi:hypothetical protein
MELLPFHPMRLVPVESYPSIFTAEAVNPAPVGTFQLAALKSCSPVEKVLAAPRLAQVIVVQTVPLVGNASAVFALNVIPSV